MIKSDVHVRNINEGRRHEGPDSQDTYMLITLRKHTYAHRLIVRLRNHIRLYKPLQGL